MKILDMLCLDPILICPFGVSPSSSNSRLTAKDRNER